MTPKDGCSRGGPGADIHIEARPRLPIGGEHYMLRVASATMMTVGRRAVICRACAYSRYRRYVPWTLSHT